MSDINIIREQTGINNETIIKNTLQDNNGSIPDTIMKLMNYTYSYIDDTPYSKHTTEFKKVREIVSEKENIFYNLMNTVKKQNDNNE